jgi:hypothetical protein
MSGQNPKNFGPPTWSVGHLLSLAYDFIYPTKGKLEDSYKRAMNIFFTIVTMLLECSTCRADGTWFNDHMGSSVPDAVFSNTIFERFVQLHNHVNQKLSKSHQWTNEEAKQFWGEKWDTLGEQGRITILYEYVMRIMIHYESYHSEEKAFLYERFLSVLPYLISMMIGKAIPSKELAQVEKPREYTNRVLALYANTVFTIMCRASIKLPNAWEIAQKVSNEFTEDAKTEPKKAVDAKKHLLLSYQLKEF